MKQKTKIGVVLLLVVVLLCGLPACQGPESTKTSEEAVITETTQEIPAEGLWKDATYRSTTVLGQGSREVKVRVEAEGKALLFLLKTDETTLGAALSGSGLVEGTRDQYGLYIKKVNGILADYNVDQSYWAIFEGDTPAMTGADSISLVDGVTYRLVRTK